MSDVPTYPPVNEKAFAATQRMWDRAYTLTLAGKTRDEVAIELGVDKTRALRMIRLGRRRAEDRAKAAKS